MRVPPRPDRTATLRQILVFYDEPQLALLRTDRDLDMLGVAVEAHDQDEYLFFACAITEKTLGRYIEGTYDLNFVFRNPDYGLYMFDWRNMDDTFTVPVRRATNSETMNEDFYPEPGFFSRSHTYQLPSQHTDGGDTHKYLIDGSWKAQDFSNFYSHLADLYAFYLIAANITEHMVADDEFLFAKEAANKYFWRGGNSYVQFFRDLSAHIEDDRPLKVSKIAYASPGSIDLSGDGPTLTELEQLIYLVGTNHGKLSNLYRQIDQTLAREGLRTAKPDAEFSAPSIAEFVYQRTKELVAGLNISNSERLYMMCSQNKVLFAKVVLALYRRANRLYLFHAQGRVQPQRRV